MQVDNMKQALSDYDKALRHRLGKADATVVYVRRGEANFALGRHVDAVSDYDYALLLNSEYGEAYYKRGEANSVLGRLQEAQADFEKAFCIALKYDYQDLLQRGRLQNMNDGSVVCE